MDTGEKLLLDKASELLVFYEFEFLKPYEFFGEWAVLESN